MADEHDESLVRVYTSTGPADATLVKNLLNSHEIRAVVQGDTLWGARGAVPMGPSTAPSVWVTEADVERARVLIEEYEAHTPSDAPPWKCRSCGEKIGGRFNECWRCGAGRSETSE